MSENELRMSQGPFFIPQGAPPGSPLLTEEERPPEAVYYFRIYAVLTILSWLGGFASGLWVVLEPTIRTGGRVVHPVEWVLGFLLIIASCLFIGAHAYAAFAGRAKSVYTLSVVLIGLSMLFNVCCLPVTIPLLIVWMKPETKRWYGIN